MNEVDEEFLNVSQKARAIREKMDGIYITEIDHFYCPKSHEKKENTSKKLGEIICNTYIRERFPD